VKGWREWAYACSDELLGDDGVADHVEAAAVFARPAWRDQAVLGRKSRHSASNLVPFLGERADAPPASGQFLREKRTDLRPVLLRRCRELDFHEAPRVEVLLRRQICIQSLERQGAGRWPSWIDQLACVHLSLQIMHADVNTG